MALDILRLVAGLVILIVAADRLVISAVRIAKILDVSVVIIGAVIVGFGTSVPEFVVSGLAASAGNLDLAMSNIVASNTANITLVLGVAALIASVATSRLMMRREGVLMLAAVGALSVVLADQLVSRWEGLVLSIGMVVAIALLIYWARSEPDVIDEEVDDITSLSLPAEVDVETILLAGLVTEPDRLAPVPPSYGTNSTCQNASSWHRQGLSRRKTSAG